MKPVRTDMERYRKDNSAAAGPAAALSDAVQRIDDPAAMAGLFATAGPGSDVFDSCSWFANFVEFGLDAGDQPHFDVVTGRDGAACLVPTCSRPDRAGPLRGRLLAGLSNVYTCRYAPPGLEALEPEAAEEAAAAWVSSIRKRNDRPTRILFEALDDRSPSLGALDRALRQGGFWVERYAHFGNWFLPVGGLDMARYWADRPAALRNTVRRKEKAMRRAHRVELEIIADVPQADRAVTAYEQVHRASWKPPEPYPRFMEGLIRRGLAAGLVRLGLLWLDAEPAAAQLWLVARRKATIFKLSHDRRHRSWSPGSILTRHMIAEALAGGGLDEIDFGRGDDPYKSDWLPQRRQRWGLAAYDPLRPCGFALAVRNLGPRAVRRLVGGGRSGDVPSRQQAP